jgi:transcriptional regulator with XRE-family HTH domain
MRTELPRDAASENFEELVRRIESSEAYDIEDARYEISEWLYSAMEVRGKKKSDLAEMLNTSRAYVTKLLQGNGNFTVETLVKLSRALGYKFKPTFIERVAVQTLAPQPTHASFGSGYSGALGLQGSITGAKVVSISGSMDERLAS